MPLKIYENVELASGAGRIVFSVFICDLDIWNRLFTAVRFQFEENGFAVIEDFLSADEVAEIHAVGSNLHKDAPEKDRKKFFASVLESEQAQHKENYFIQSSNKVRYFFENGALDEDGNLVVDSAIALNKVGHALHSLHPTFKKYTHNERVRAVAATLGFRKPAVPQSMYIFKNPGIGGEGEHCLLQRSVAHLLFN